MYFFSQALSTDLVFTILFENVELYFLGTKKKKEKDLLFVVR